MTPLSLNQPDALRRVMDQVLGGGHVTVTARESSAEALLDEAAANLAIQGSRVFRAAATLPSGVSVAWLVAQVTGHLMSKQQGDRVLEQVFRDLTILDATCHRIVLLVTNAEVLQKSTLRYLQLATRAGSALQLVMAGKPEFLDSLAAQDLVPLYTRLTANSVVELRPAKGRLIAAAVLPQSRPSRAASPAQPNSGVRAGELLVPRATRPDGFLSRRTMARTAAGLVVAACAVAGIWASQGSSRLARTFEAETPSSAESTNLPPYAASPGSTAVQAPVPPAPQSQPASQGLNPESAPDAGMAAPVAPKTNFDPATKLRQATTPPQVAAPAAAAPPGPRRQVTSVLRQANARLDALFSATAQPSVRQGLRTRAGATGRDYPRTAKLMDNTPDALTEVVQPEALPVPPPEVPFPAIPENANGRGRYIGTFATDASGIRTFHVTQ